MKSAPHGLIGLFMGNGGQIPPLLVHAASPAQTATVNTTLMDHDPSA
jgi:hypothetical protein